MHRPCIQIEIVIFEVAIFLRRAGQDTLSQLASLLFGPERHRSSKKLSLRIETGLHSGWRMLCAKDLDLVLALKKGMEFLG